MTKDDSTNQILQRRARKSGPGRWFKWLAILACFCILVAVGVAVGGYLYYSRDLPSAEALRKYTPPQTTRIVDRKGTLLAELYTERRTVVSMEKVPRVLVLSVLAAEDADFYHHAGMDLDRKSTRLNSSHRQ